MSSSFAEQLESYRSPTVDDLEISLPPRPAPAKKEEVTAGDDRALGQHGGGADGTPTSDTHGEVTSSAATEPQPQRDEPDDGEHTDATQEAVEAREREAAERAEAAAEPTDVEQAREVEPEPEPEPTAQASKVVEKPKSVREQLAATEGTAPRAFTRVAASYGKDSEGVDVPTVSLKPFPQPAIDKLRVLLAQTVGGDFAEAIPAPALLAAFVMAKTGLELDVDDNTAAAIEAFRWTDPRLTMVESRMNEVAEVLGMLTSKMSSGIEKINQTATVVDGVEMATSYLVADRVAHLSTSDVDETNVDVTQKKSLATRERIRAATKAQRTIEKQREGRRMS